MLDFEDVDERVTQDYLEVGGRDKQDVRVDEQLSRQRPGILFLELSIASPGFFCRVGKPSRQPSKIRPLFAKAAFSQVVSRVAFFCSFFFQPFFCRLIKIG